MPNTTMNPNVPATPPPSKTTGPIEKKALKPTITKNVMDQDSKG